MNSIAIIGVGSPWGADCLAKKVIDLLLPDLSNQYFLDYLDRPGLSLLTLIKAFNTVHLVDAVSGKAPIGFIYRYKNIEAFKKSKNIFSTHGLGLVETLLLGDALDLLPEKIIIHGVEMGKTPQETLFSSRIEESCFELARRIKGELLFSEKEFDDEA